MVLFVEKVAVIGAGTMGARIAEVLALNGKSVVLKEVDEDPLERGMQMIRKDLDDLVAFHESKGEREIARIEKNGIKLTDDQKEAVRKSNRPTFTKDRTARALEKLEPTTAYDKLEGVDLVIEAVVENLDIKKMVFQEVQKVVDSRTVFATNTSALPVSKIAEATDRPSRFIGTHFFNPPTTLPLVEVIPGEKTDEETTMDVMNFLSELRNHRYPMQPVQVKETPGFLVNRVLGAMMNEVFLCHEEKVASPRDIDRAMKAGAGFPMGPLELGDMIGLDVLKAVQDTLRPFMLEREKKFATVVDRLVEQGRLGKKSGAGFFDYT
jgi:3-hydroxybutyryl-CoA dehydrogenase